MNLDELDDICGDNPEHDTDGRIVRAGFGYHGSKRKSVEHILPHLPYDHIFVDVFGGSGIITLNRRPSVKLDVYNDRWSGVSNFFHVMRTRSEELLQQLEILVMSKELFYEYKNWDQGDDLERAVRWYYMIQCSYGHLGRNWGYSPTRFIGHRYYKRLEYFPMIAERFKTVQVDNADFRDVFKMYDSNRTVFYVDPPYINSAQSGSYVHKFKEQDHYDLLDYVWDAKGYVAVSHRPNELYDSRPWDDIVEWEIHGSSHGGQSETNHRIGAKINEIRKERLYIKDYH